MGFSKQAYYQYQQAAQQVSQKTPQLLEQVRLYRQQLPRLGTRKLHYLLGQDGYCIGRDALFTLLRNQNMLVKKKRSFIRTTDSRGWMRQYPNLVNGIVPSAPEEIWVADITYLLTRAGTYYLHLVSDAYSKRIMGYEVCQDLLASSSVKALRMALANRRYNRMTIHHSDRGLQYSSRLYTEVLRQAHCRISTTQDGNPYDNAVAERINGILKAEFGLDNLVGADQSVEPLVVESIRLYNEVRPHLSCAYLRPDQMHQQEIVMLKTYRSKKSEPLSAPISPENQS